MTTRFSAKDSRSLPVVARSSMRRSPRYVVERRNPSYSKNSHRRLLTRRKCSATQAQGFKGEQGELSDRGAIGVESIIQELN